MNIFLLAIMANIVFAKSPIPHTPEDVKDFWDIQKYVLMSNQKNTQVINVMDVYISILFKEAENIDDIKELAVFTKLSDGAAEEFVDYWLQLLKHKTSLFSKAYLHFSTDLKEYFKGYIIYIPSNEIDSYKELYPNIDLFNGL